MITEDDQRGLNTALNESSFLGATVDRSARTVTLWFEVLTLPEEGPEPDDRVVVLVVGDVVRVVASLRDGRWDDPDAPALPLEWERLDAAVREFGGSPIYGWEFIDPPENSWDDWRDRLSFDEVLSPRSAAHVIELFQEGTTADRHLDLRVWFNELRIMDRRSESIPLGDFITGGARWWDAMFARDERTSGHGIVPGRRD